MNDNELYFRHLRNHDGALYYVTGRGYTCLIQALCCYCNIPTNGLFPRKIWAKLSSAVT